MSVSSQGLLFEPECGVPFSGQRTYFIKFRQCAWLAGLIGEREDDKETTQRERPPRCASPLVEAEEEREDP